MSPRDSKKLEEISSSLNQHYEDKVRPCIDLVDSLRSLGVEKDLSLPAIAVIGDQSSGKSSVLEALSGVALPRGTGIVTRCPLVLKLKRVEAGVAWSGILSYQGQLKILQKPEDVGHAVSNAQVALAGQGKGISHEMIALEIKSSNVPDLTLIDLPGIARVATGDQPVDIEKQIKDLIEKFIKRQETISLVVVPANIDIATTEALKMASKVDPHGQRTLGILTKPDLVDKGAEETVVSTVNNQVIPLKKGYMMVKCRGQQDINANLSLAKALQNERDFFEQHPHFRPLLEEEKATVPLLAQRLTKELVEHIGRSLPHLKNQIEKKLDGTAMKLKQLGEGVPQEENDKKNFLIEKINAFNQVLADVMRAEEDIKNSDTRVFTKIRDEFGKWKAQLDKKTNTFEENLRDEVEEYTRIRRGKELPGFINYRTFENIVRKHVEELEEPALKLLRDITDIVHSSLNDIANPNFEAYPNLLRAAKEPIEDLREQEYEKAKERVRAQFKMERMVYSQDGLYSWKLEAVKMKPETARPFLTKVISADVREMAQHLRAYFSITSDRLANQVPLIVQYHVLHQYIAQLQTAMLAIIGEKDAVKLIQEDSDLARRRVLARERLERLRRARQVLSKFVHSAS
ncbi:interferon-induced GTP-binding protein Mx-like isoform X2 [Salminus brasiliensis]